MTARRYNKGKLRYELLPSFALSKLAEVYTKGAEKYTIYDEDGSIKDDGANNWRSGLPWMDTVASVQRHIQQWKEGEDIDKDLGTYHLANAAWGLFALLEYYKLHPELDDRPHDYLKGKRVGLDLDDVLADWCPNFCKVANIPIPTTWHFGFKEHVEKLIKEGFDYENFMLNLPVKTEPLDIPFEPTCYITHRVHVPQEVSAQWIKDKGFPQVPVIQTADKVAAAKEMNLDLFIDDKFDTFVEMNKAGICCYLMSAPHNLRYNIGYKRIYSLKELGN